MAKPFRLMPGPRGLPIIGSVLDYSFLGKYSFERMYLAKRENLQKYGKIYKEKMGRHIVQLFDPVDIETVFRADGKLPLRPALPLQIVAHKRDKEPLGLGALNGDEWWSIRRVVQRCMMHPDAASPYLPIQNLVADDLIQLIDQKLDGRDGEVDNLLNFLQRYTMEAFGAVCFGVRMGCLDKDVTPGSKAHQLMTASSNVFQALQKTTFSFPSYAIYRTPIYKQFIESLDVCNSIARSHVEVALQSDQQKAPSTNTESVSSSALGCPNFLRTLIEGHSERLSSDQLVGLATDLFISGIDSTAYALSFCLYYLARNPEKQSKLISVLDTVVPRGSQVTVNTFTQLSYLKACVKESFRLTFPVEAGPTRELGRDLTLGGFEVPKGTLVSLNHQTMCLQEEYFESADSYIPERWIKDSGSELRPAPSFVMLPFGYGPRMCIGRRFAEQEIYLAIIKMLQHYRLEYHHGPLGLVNRVFTMPDGPVLIKLIPR